VSTDSTSRNGAFRGKTVVVTGGSRGVGLMIAEGFVAAGADVIISARKAAACDEAAEALKAHGTCISVPADLATAAGQQLLIDAVKARTGQLDVLVNNAGATWGAPIDEYPLDAFDKVLDINVKSVFALTQGLLPLLRAAAENEQSARVINIGSVDGLSVPRGDTFAYSASKAAVHMLTRHLAKALAADQITVNAIAPGPFPSKMMAYVLDDEQAAAELIREVPLGRVGRAEDIAGLCEFLAGPRAGWLTGAVIPLDGGVTL
jgi:NAD(P)-dependent dehydrogenase (short-subunit alcohol dehydrogenase family)